MKKEKIMLLSLAVFALLGAALSFKAKTYNSPWCYTTTALDQDATKSNCILFLENRINLAGPPNVYATTLDNEGDPIVDGGQCTPLLTCPKRRLIPD